MRPGKAVLTGGRLFGMKTSANSRPARAVTVGDGYVGLNINPRRAGRSAGLDHFGIEVDDSNATFARIGNLYPTVNWLERPSTRPFAGITTHDPDGNMFDISQRAMTNRTSVYVENDGKANPRHIDHVALRTMNPDAMAEFYRTIFRLRTRPAVPITICRTAISRWSSCRGTSQTMTARRIIAPGIDHIGFKVEDLDAFTTDLEQVAAANPRLAPAPIDTGTEGKALAKLFERTCPLGQRRLADPDGTLIDVRAA
jgi:catechol 2,3-dioxygenase-like lactoylglutathione lyase family enzyme